MHSISFNIYGKKLNEGDFSLGTAIIHFCGKLYQKINFKIHLNIVARCK